MWFLYTTFLISANMKISRPPLKPGLPAVFSTFTTMPRNFLRFLFSRWIHEHGIRERFFWFLFPFGTQA